MSCPPRLVAFFGSDAPRVVEMYSSRGQSFRLAGMIQHKVQTLQSDLEELEKRRGKEIEQMRAQVMQQAADLLELQQRMETLARSCDDMEASVDTFGKRFMINLKNFFGQQELSAREIAAVAKMNRKKIEALHGERLKAETRLGNQRHHLEELLSPMESLRFAIDSLGKRLVLEGCMQEDIHRGIQVAVRETVRNNSLAMLRYKVKRLQGLCETDVLLASILDLKEIDDSLCSLEPFLGCRASDARMAEPPDLLAALKNGIDRRDGRIEGRVHVRGPGIFYKKESYTNGNGHSSTRIRKIPVTFAGQVAAKGTFDAVFWHMAPTISGLRKIASESYAAGRRQAVEGSLVPKVTAWRNSCVELCRTILSELEKDIIDLPKEST